MAAGGIALLVCAPGVGAGASTVLVIKAIGMKAAGGALLAGGMAGDEYLVIKLPIYCFTHGAGIG